MSFDVAHMCRICLSQETVIPYIDFFSHEGKFYEKVQMLANIEIQSNPGIPTLICANCIDNLERAIKFRKIVVNNNEKYKNLLAIADQSTQQSNSVIIKEEPMIIDLKGVLDNENYEQLNGAINEFDQICDDPTQELLDEIKEDPVDINLLQVNETKFSIAKNQCRKCGKNFNNAAKLNFHVKKMHNQKLPTPQFLKQKPNIFPCKRPDCPKTYKTINARAQHMRDHKNFDSGENTCDICGKAFVRKYHLDLHKKRHERNTKKTEEVTQN